MFLIILLLFIISNYINSKVILNIGSIGRKPEYPKKTFTI